MERRTRKARRRGAFSTLNIQLHGVSLMKSSRFLLAAVAAGFLSTALAATAQPTANQVTVPPGGGGGGGHAKLQALFDNEQEFLMFRMQMRQATKGMSKDQRKAYRRQ